MYKKELQNAAGMKRRGVGVGGGPECVSGLGQPGDSGSVTTSGQPRRGTPFTTLAQQTLTSPAATITHPAMACQHPRERPGPPPPPARLPLPRSPSDRPRNPRGPAKFYPRGHTHSGSKCSFISSPVARAQRPPGRRRSQVK